MINLDNDKDTLVKESENDELIVSLYYVKAAPLKVFVQDKLVAVNFVENDLDDTIEDEINEVAVQLVKSLFLPLGAPSVSNVTPVESLSSSNKSLAAFITITTLVQEAVEQITLESWLMVVICLHIQPDCDLYLGR